jgi:hypothetical protein
MEVERGSKARIGSTTLERVLRHALGRGQNCPKTSPISHYQGKMACESMVRPKFHRSGKEACPG